NECWKNAVKGFNDSVKKIFDDTVLKINNKLDDINIEGRELIMKKLKKRQK
ncbi:8372_t:CDS:1, partial [Racocetra persica]